MSTLAPSFLIGSSSHLQVTRTFIISRTSSKFDQIGPRTVELAALERLENLHRLIMGKTMSSHFLRNFDWILFIFAGNEDMYKSLNESKIRPDATTGFHGNHRGIMEKMLCPL